MSRFLNVIIESINFARNDFKERPTFFMVETVGTLLNISGALLIALLNEQAPFLLVWILFTAGAFILVYITYVRRFSNLMLLMIVYAIIDIFGLINSLL